MRNFKVTILAAFAAIMMFAFSFAMVPIYNVLCKKIGLNTGKAIAASPDFSREIMVQFVTSNNQNLPWVFYPLQKVVKIHPGENNKIFFYMKNNTQHTMTVQAIPSLSPPLSVKYFHKVQCFCFNKQTLNGGEVMKLPMIFQIDRKIPEEINTITLAYTLFNVTNQLKSMPT
jgi:cytochrome c oxidase assembly protein subunit 11